MTATYALILAGGAGTRFWPASRMQRPKQLLPLVGEAPLLLETARRVLPLTGGWDKLLVGTGRHLVAASASILPELPEASFLTEPVPRNTAPCIGWAAARVAQIDPDAVVMVLPSDHHIADVARFRSALALAVDSARSGIITTIGIKPTHPETGFGYIELDPEALAPAPGAVLARRFVEKPDRARAEQFLASGRFLWNAGMFFFRAKDMMGAIAAHQPALADGLAAMVGAAPADAPAVVERIFPALPSVSIDFGVMEHLDRLAVIPGDFGWSDLGTWQSAWELAARDHLGNAAPEGTIFVDSRDNQVVDLRTAAHHKRVVALVGVHDLVVVETDDALLVVPRERAQDVKHVVDQLKGRGDDGLI
jgi:mannose-1-phosphate guanylyltransferase